MIGDNDQLKKMLIRRLNTTKIMANDDLNEGTDINSIIEYLIETEFKELKSEDISLWHHLMYSYGISEISTFEEILSALSLENVFKSDPNSTSYKILEGMLKRIKTDSGTLLQKVLKDEESKKEIDIKELAESI